MRRSRLPVVPLAVLVLAAPGATSPFSGCSSSPGRACTLIGCNDGVGFFVARDAIEPVGAVSVRLCLDGRCRTERPPAEVFSQPGGTAFMAAFRPGALDPRREHRASITIRDGETVVYRLARRVALTRNQPNGPGCGPVCHQTDLRITAPDVRDYQSGPTP